MKCCNKFVLHPNILTAGLPAESDTQVGIMNRIKGTPRRDFATHYDPMTTSRRYQQREAVDAELKLMISGEVFKKSKVRF